MNTFIKVGLVGGIIALVVWGAKAAQRAIAAFQFDIVSYGRPTLSGLILTVPLQIRYSNPTPLPINVDKLIGDIYLNKNGTFVLAARVNQPVTLSPGESTQWLNPTLDLQSVFGGNLLNTIAAIQQIMVNKKLTIRSDVKAIYQGITLPEQSFTSQIDLS